jgi:stage II sporulation protein D
VVDTVKNTVIRSAANLNTTVVAYRQGFSFGNMQARASKIMIRPLDANPILINGRQFRGALQLTRKENQRMLVVNYIEMEDYVKGILYHEVSHYWPMEALKVQAVISRTYALYQCEQNKPRDYDVTSDIYSQVYGGRTSERYRTTRAVEETRGQVVTYQGNVLPAYFHATCAGHTQDASLLWNINIAPLKGVKCNFCSLSPHFQWYEVMSLKEMRDFLTGAGYAVKNIKEIRIAGKDPSGRVTSIQIVSDDNEISVPAKDFRSIVGPNVIRSTNFTVSVVEGDVIFQGVGWGHGAGLCQWGAYFMAKSGRDYREILKYYYPGSQLTSLTAS